jgi:hypothetical protein
VIEVDPKAGQPIRVTGRGESISLAQGGCYVNFHNSDAVAIFDAVSEVLADNRRFAEQHHKGRHNRKPRKRETEQHADAEAE